MFYLNLVRVDLECDGVVLCDRGRLVVLVILVELLVELADILRHCAVRAAFSRLFTYEQ